MGAGRSTEGGSLADPEDGDLVAFRPCGAQGMTRLELLPIFGWTAGGVVACEEGGGVWIWIGSGGSVVACGEGADVKISVGPGDNVGCAVRFLRRLPDPFLNQLCPLLVE